MQKVALGLEYDGSLYRGWQKQDNLKTIQACLENALSIVANHPISVVCAGRTDAGVHALGQVVHFENVAARTMRSWVMGGNAHLSPDITIRWAKIVEADFHARFSALSRSYRYTIYNCPIRTSIFQKNSTWWHRPLNVDWMQEAANHLLGEHDFTSFRGVSCQAKSTVRTILGLTVKRAQDFVVIEVKANAFLQHMVRNIVGSLIAVGEGKKMPFWIKEVLMARDRKKAGITAPPNGLCLIEVEYPQIFKLPQESRTISQP